MKSVMRAVVGAKRFQEPVRTQDGKLKGYWILKLDCGHELRKPFEGVLPTRPVRVRCRKCSAKSEEKECP